METRKDGQLFIKVLPLRLVFQSSRSWKYRMPPSCQSWGTSAPCPCSIMWQTPDTLSRSWFISPNIACGARIYSMAEPYIACGAAWRWGWVEGGRRSQGSLPNIRPPIWLLIADNLRDVIILDRASMDCLLFNTELFQIEYFRGRFLPWT